MLKLSLVFQNVCERKLEWYSDLLRGILSGYSILFPQSKHIGLSKCTLGVCAWVFALRRYTSHWTGDSASYLISAAERHPHGAFLPKKVQEVTGPFLPEERTGDLCCHQCRACTAFMVSLHHGFMETTEKSLPTTKEAGTNWDCSDHKDGWEEAGATFPLVNAWCFKAFK